MDINFLKEDCWVDREYKHMLACPKCGFEYNHFAGIDDLLGWESREDMTEESLIGVQHWGGRGDGHSILLEGECGHMWRLNLGFHKGNISIWGTYVCDKNEILGTY